MFPNHKIWLEINDEDIWKISKYLEITQALLEEKTHQDNFDYILKLMKQKYDAPKLRGYS